MFSWSTSSPSRPHPLQQDAKKPSLSKVVRDDVLALILGGQLVPGQRISEPDMATRLNVSRVPVREALRELESSGLVISRKNSGVFVRQIDAQEIADLYDLRSALEAHAGLRAAGLPKRELQSLVALLDGSIAAMEDAAKDGDTKAYYLENLNFHWLIVEATGNDQLAHTYRGIVQKLHLSRLKNLGRPVGIAASIAEHERIVDALRAADAQACSTLMGQHVSDALRRLQDLPPDTA